MMQNKRNIFIWLIAGVVFLFFMMNLSKNTRFQEMPWSSFLDKIEADGLTSVEIGPEMVVMLTKSGEKFQTRIPHGERSYLALLREHHVIISVSEPSKDWNGILAVWILPIFGVLLLLFIFRRMMGNMGGGGLRGGPFNLGKLGSKQVQSEEIQTTFADVAGMEEAKADLVEVVDYLTNPKKYERLGGRVPRGLLLTGLPGTGKTLLARAVAGEAKVPFFRISGSEFVEMFVGVGAARVREFFDHARKAAPSMVFIDEIDAVGRSRGFGLGNGNDEREQTLNQILVEMDGFNKGKDSVIMIAATNRPDVLDVALLRPGRFDRRIIVPMPDLKAREAILRVHSRGKILAPDVDLGNIARLLHLGFTGADIENMVNEAALIAARLNKDAITQSDFLAARDRVIMGPERKTMIISEQEKKVIAYHEAGHAIVATYTPEVDPVERITIVPRGTALGVTMRFPERDLYLYSLSRLTAEISVCLGGRLAEDIVFGEITTGAENDLKRATDIVKAVVMKYGMSELGERVYGVAGEENFFGRSLGGPDYSEDTARKIDEEMGRIFASQKKRVQDLFLEHRSKLDALAKALLEKETIEGAELKVILGMPEAVDIQV